MKKQELHELKILSIGNSFSVDTMEYVPNIALALGIKKIKLGNLYVGGCSIEQHYNHAKNDMPVYTYYENDGLNWTSTANVKIKDALQSENWDWVSIQHGTGDGSCHTSEKSYSKLRPLLEYVKAFILPNTKIAYNTTWVGEPNYPHHEMVSYGGNQLLLYTKIMEMIQKTVLPIQTIDRIIPTGTAIQNARTAVMEPLTRDGYHLSFDKGRYIAGLTFFKSITNISIEDLHWSPDGVNREMQSVAINSVNDAIQKPFALTKQNVSI